MDRRHLRGRTASMGLLRQPTLAEGLHRLLHHEDMEGRDERERSFLVRHSRSRPKVGGRVNERIPITRIEEPESVGTQATGISGKGVGRVTYSEHITKITLQRFHLLVSDS